MKSLKKLVLGLMLSTVSMYFAPKYLPALMLQIQNLKSMRAGQAPDGRNPANAYGEQIPQQTMSGQIARAMDTAKAVVAKATGEKGVATNKDYEEFVTIQGKLYRKSADNTYMVNGQRVFYVDNRKQARLNDDSETLDLTPYAGGQQVRDPAEYERAAAQVPAQPTGDQGLEVPADLGEMMKTLKKSQDAMKERDEYLKTLEE